MFALEGVEPVPDKKIHKLILKSFVGPFLIAFSVILFVLVLQFLAKYMEDIMEGFGVGCVDEGFRAGLPYVLLIFGLGNVGSGALKYWPTNADQIALKLGFRLQRRSRVQPFGCDEATARGLGAVTTNHGLAGGRSAPEVDVVAELVGGTPPRARSSMPPSTTASRSSLPTKN